VREAQVQGVGMLGELHVRKGGCVHQSLPQCTKATR
jgi:hypothetical protein